MKNSTEQKIKTDEKTKNPATLEIKLICQKFPPTEATASKKSQDKKEGEILER